MTATADERLAQRAAAGDERALAAVYRRYHQDLYRYCLAIVGNSEDAQDALQNTMVKVLRALPGEERQIELKPWLYRIAHNESVELLRRRRPSEELDPEQAPPPGSDLAEDLAARERLRRLIADIEQLPERQRGALVMRELAGLGYEEIATALGTSPAVARQTLYEARLSLHQIEVGREMNCDAVTRALSDADGRVTRRRDIRAHLRACSDCRRFRTEIEGRRGDLAALAPLPAVAAAGLLQGLLGGAAGSGTGAAAGAGATGAAAAKSLGAAAALKSAAAVAVVAAVGVGAADRAGVVDLTPSGGGNTQQQARGAAGQASKPPSSSAAPAATAAPAAEGAAGVGTANESAAVRQASALGEGGARPATAPGQEDSGSVDSAPGSSSDATTAAPAGGSHPHGRGHEKQHPSAADHGQQTAAAHNAGGKGSGQGQGESKGHSEKAHPDHPPKPTKPPKPTQAAQPDPPGGAKAKAPKQAPAEPEAAVPPAPEAPPVSHGPKEAPDKGHGSAFQP